MLHDETIIACAEIAWQRVKDTWAASRVLNNDFTGSACLEALTICERIKELSPHIDWVALGIHVHRD